MIILPTSNCFFRSNFHFVATLYTVYMYVVQMFCTISWVQDFNKAKIHVEIVHHLQHAILFCLFQVWKYFLLPTCTVAVASFFGRGEQILWFSIIWNHFTYFVVVILCKVFAKFPVYIDIKFARNYFKLRQFYSFVSWKDMLHVLFVSTFILPWNINI